MSMSMSMKLPMMLSVDAFGVAPTRQYHTLRSSEMRLAGHNKLDANPLNIVHKNSGSDTEGIAGNDILTSAIIKCAYDGTYFRGWTAGNSDLKNDQHHDGKSDNNGDDNKHPPKRKQTRRSRTLQRKGGGYGKQYGRVRTVDDTIRFTLAKIYGNIDAKRIIIEACSRTDAGVHAHSLVAQFYCTNSSSPTHDIMTTRPTSHEDTSNFLPLPFGSDLSKLVFVLNRMLPPDVRVLAASPLPHLRCNNNSGHSDPFHPALHTMSKTYTYKFALGSIHDPLQSQHVWHLDGSSSRAVGMNGKRFRLERALAAANLFCTAKPQDYGAFRSAFRGTDRGRMQSTLCKLWKCDILHETKEQLPSWEIGSSQSSHAIDRFEDRFMHHGSRLVGTQVERSGLNDCGPQTFTVTITGDRFLYKMIRNIVGTIVAVGCGHLELDDVRNALDTGTWDGNSTDDTPQSRRICAPARGLTLVAVNYPKDIDFDWQTG